MAKHSDDDLFSSSTMSFGEHLEELRVALFRALSGVMVGFLIGLYVANDVVLFIQRPLEKALDEYYLKKGELDLKEKYAGKVPPEELTVVTKDHMVSDSIRIEPFELLDEIQQEYPDSIDRVQITRYQFIPADIELENVVPLCAQIRKDGEDEKDSPGKAIWANLSGEEQAQIAALADLGAADENQRGELVAVLNRLIEKPALHESQQFDDFHDWDAFGSNVARDSNIAEAAGRIRQQLAESFDADQSRRLNRFVVASVYEKQIRRPRLRLMEIKTWKPKDVTIQSLSAHEAFMIWLKAALIAGIIISSPWLFWQIWAFVAAGLYRHERRFVWIFLPFSLGLFLAGAALAFFFVFEPVLRFLFSFNRGMNIDPDPRISEWLGFVLFLPIGFGISFQLPLVMLFLERIGIFTVENYLTRWRVAILVIFVLAMLLTPADPISMLLMAIPLTVLYFGGVALCRWMPRSRSPFELPEEI